MQIIFFTTNTYKNWNLNNTVQFNLGKIPS